MNSIKNIEDKIKLSKERVNNFLLNINADTKSFGIKKPSSYYDTNTYKDMLLPATYNATHCLTLTECYNNLEKDKKESIINFILSFRGDDDYFYMREMKEHSIIKETNPFDKEYVREYVNFHITNYSLGALSSLGYDVSKNLAFLECYGSVEKLEKWMSKRNWADPWAEGNFIVNLASFYLMAMKADEKKYKPMIDYFLYWHDKNQDPKTGYWGTDIQGVRDTQEHAMAGAAHNLHIYYYTNRELKYVDVIVDYCIDYLNYGVRSACLDIDVVDVLSHLYAYDYRRHDIENAFEQYAHKLINFQNDDGGFADVKSGLRRFDSWATGYFEPQGLSNCFATWFRTATLAMIDCTLFPNNKNNWTFRDTIGIGYYNKNYLK